MSIAIGRPAGLCHGNRVFELHKSAAGMRHGCLDRDDHATSQRQISIETLVTLWRVGREPWRFMADKAHAMGHEVKAGHVGGGCSHAKRFVKDVTAPGSLPDRL